MSASPGMITTTPELMTVIKALAAYAPESDDEAMEVRRVKRELETLLNEWRWRDDWDSRWIQVRRTTVVEDAQRRNLEAIKMMNSLKVQVNILAVRERDES